MKRIVAVSSSGGHWEQLMLLSGSFEGHDVTYLTTMAGLAERNSITDALLVPDCNRNTPFQTVVSAWKIFKIIARVRPQVIVTTGAAPGIIAIAIGRLFKAKTIWIESVANSEQLSMSGRIAGYLAHEQFTQWEHLARENGPKYVGAVL
ncbi:glucuronosyltransferase (plasmid) [Rhizobium rosettiformans]|uniref:Glucuronosyltransferase n=1 Tax=Rhizobium rosettiformans TaxID=1368430 RepID=A0ABX7F3I1_9HYPH|nr:glucuronosyltransferase [Rhizobium rosettiformans]QRF54331.1 glucuronosyltransferase [Rhizobium rosettiformans]